MLALALLMRLARYPILDPSVQAHYLSSFDRSGGNDDGFDGTYSALYVDANGEDAGTNPHHRWGESDFLLPEPLTRDARRLEIEMRPLQPGWNEFRYELWGLP
ncbi:MAG: hypothetical protein ACRD21_19295 [Vicinamibacteria bacterium]